MRVIRVIFLSLFVFYLIFFISFRNGYYSYQNYKRTSLTNEEIRVFERDVKDGKDINIKKYLDVHKDYSNRLSNFGYFFSNSFCKIFNFVLKNSLEKLVKFLI